MTLKEYLTARNGTASWLAKKLGVSMSYLSQMASGKANIAPKRAVEIEQATDGIVSRKDMFPDDWHEIWPELAQQEQKKKEEAA